MCFRINPTEIRKAAPENVFRDKICPEVSLEKSNSVSRKLFYNIIRSENWFASWKYIILRDHDHDIMCTKVWSTHWVNVHIISCTRCTKLSTEYSTSQHDATEKYKAILKTYTILFLSSKQEIRLIILKFRYFILSIASTVERIIPSNLYWILFDSSYRL